MVELMRLVQAFAVKRKAGGLLLIVNLRRFSLLTVVQLVEITGNA